MSIERLKQMFLGEIETNIDRVDDAITSMAESPDDTDFIITLRVDIEEIVSSNKNARFLECLIDSINNTPTINCTSHDRDVCKHALTKKLTQINNELEKKDLTHFKDYVNDF